MRADELEVAEGSAAYVIAWHRDLDGELLDKRVAAVELINVLRPVVAVARYVTFAALALHEHPGCRQELLDGDDYPEFFVQEVRRFYPFFPFVAGRVRDEFDWRGRHFAKGTWVLLDLYGTNHDARIWGTRRSSGQRDSAGGRGVLSTSSPRVEAAITMVTVARANAHDRAHEEVGAPAAAKPNQAMALSVSRSMPVARAATSPSIVGIHMKSVDRCKPIPLIVPIFGVQYTSLSRG